MLAVGGQIGTNPRHVTVRLQLHPFQAFCTDCAQDWIRKATLMRNEIHELI